jgi:hypothetical protein
LQRGYAAAHFQIFVPHDKKRRVSMRRFPLAYFIIYLKPRQPKENIEVLSYNTE